MSEESSKSFKLAISKKSLNKEFSKIIPSGMVIPRRFVRHTSDLSKNNSLLNNDLFEIQNLTNPTISPSEVAEWMEDLVENAINKHGLEYNRNKGTDIECLGIEFKTRMIESKSYHTIGSTSYSDILEKCWDNSPLKEKIQLQYRVTWSNIHLKVIESRIYDFSAKETQEALENAYNFARADIKKNEIQRNETYFKSKECVAHFQKIKGTYDQDGKMKNGMFQFRISHWYMNDMMARAIRSDFLKTHTKALTA